MAGGTAAVRAREKLDEHGWNTAGYLNHVTLLRAQCFLGLILDEVCEITLTNDGVTTLDHLLYVYPLAASDLISRTNC